MPENNLRQALVPVGATVIPQTRGTAPGLICPVGDKVVYAVPGVPHEMRDMIESLVQEGRTVMLSSHLLDEVQRTCHAVAIVDRGRVIRQGPIEIPAAGLPLGEIPTRDV